MTANQTLTTYYIDYLIADISDTLTYLKTLIKNRSKVRIIKNQLPYHTCDFAGFFLVSVVDRKTQAAVYIQDADDWGIELVVDDVKTADEIYDQLFSDPDLTFTQELMQYLKENWGFQSI